MRLKGSETITTMEGYKDLLIYLPSELLEMMSMMMTEPIVSKKFDVEDIRKIREYNSLRHIKMTPEEIIADIKKGVEGIMELFRKEAYVRCYSKRDNRILVSKM